MAASLVIEHLDVIEQGLIRVSWFSTVKSEAGEYFESSSSARR